MLDAMPENLFSPDYNRAVIERIQKGQYEVLWSQITSSYNGHQGTFRVFGDALKIDGVRIAGSAELQQTLADMLGCLLLTPKMLDLMFLQTATFLTPTALTQTLHDVQIMSTKTRMIYHSQLVDKKLAAAGNPAGVIVNVGKMWVLDNRLLDPHKVKPAAENYGWYFFGPDVYGGNSEPNASMFIDPKTHAPYRVAQGPGWAHDIKHVDYSQVCCLASRNCFVDGKPMDLAAVLQDPELAGLVSHQGPLKLLRQPGVPQAALATTKQPCIGPGCPPNIAWEPEEPIQRPALGPLALATAGLVLTIGGFFGGLALMTPKKSGPVITYKNPTVPRDFRPLIDAAVAQGWQVSTTGGGHLKFQSPAGRVVFAASTPSDWRASRNLRAELRRAGLSV